MKFKIHNVIGYQVRKFGSFDKPEEYEKLRKPSIFYMNGSNHTHPLVTVIGGKVFVFHHDIHSNSVSFEISTEDIPFEEMEEYILSFGGDIEEVETDW